MTRRTQTLQALDLTNLSRSQLLELVQGLHVPVPTHIKPNRQELIAHIQDYLIHGKLTTTHK